MKAKVFVRKSSHRGSKVRNKDKVLIIEESSEEENKHNSELSGSLSNNMIDL